MKLRDKFDKIWHAAGVIVFVLSVVVLVSNLGKERETTIIMGMIGILFALFVVGLIVMFIYSFRDDYSLEWGRHNFFRNNAPFLIARSPAAPEIEIPTEPVILSQGKGAAIGMFFWGIFMLVFPVLLLFLDTAFEEVSEKHLFFSMPVIFWIMFLSIAGFAVFISFFKIFSRTDECHISTKGLVMPGVVDAPITWSEIAHVEMAGAWPGGYYLGVTLTPSARALGVVKEKSRFQNWRRFGLASGDYGVLLPLPKTKLKDHEVRDLIDTHLKPYHKRVFVKSPIKALFGK